MKKIILTLILPGAILFAQSEQGSIELPDFVITGKQSVEIPIAQKKKPELVSTLSEDFILPQYSPDELPMLINSLPVPVKPDITGNNYFDGSVKIGVGSYTFPTGNFHLSKSFGNYIVSAGAWGKNIKEYVPFSGFNNSGVSLTNILFVSTKSEFLPGTQIKLDGEYSRESYNYFASAAPSDEQKIQKGFGNFSVLNTYNRWIDFGFDFGLNLLSFGEFGPKEKVIKGSALFNFKINGFIIGGKGIYNKQLLTGNLNSIEDYDFYSTEGFVKIELAKNLLFKGGLFYAGNNSEDFFAPIVSIQYKVNDGLVFSAEYNPHVNNYTYAGMLEKNMYLNPFDTDNIFSKVKAELKGSIKYEHYKYFSITISGGYSKIDNYMFFDNWMLNSFNKGRFFVNTADGVDNIYSSLDLLFHPAELGYFLGNIKFNSVKNNNGNYIPYEPKISSELIYGYDFNFGLGMKVKFQYAKDIYTDAANKIMLDDYQNLSFGISYKIWDSLSITADFQNILNRSNFVLDGYKEKPFDAIVGAEYRW